MTTINNVKVNFIAKADAIHEARVAFNNSISEAWNIESIESAKVVAESEKAMRDSDKAYKEQLDSINRTFSDIREALFDYDAHEGVSANTFKNLYVPTFRKYDVEVPSNIYAIGDKVDILRKIFSNAEIAAIEERNRREYLIGKNKHDKFDDICTTRNNHIEKANQIFKTAMLDIAVRYSEYDVMDCTDMMIA